MLQTILTRVSTPPHPAKYQEEEEVHLDVDKNVQQTLGSHISGTEAVGNKLDGGRSTEC